MGTASATVVPYATEAAGRQVGSPQQRAPPAVHRRVLLNEKCSSLEKGSMRDPNAGSFYARGSLPGLLVQSRIIRRQR